MFGYTALCPYTRTCRYVCVLVVAALCQSSPVPFLIPAFTVTIMIKHLAARKLLVFPVRVTNTRHPPRTHNTETPELPAATTDGTQPKDVNSQVEDKTTQS